MKNFSNVSIVCKGTLTLRYIYYCDFVWKFKNVKISNHLDYDFAKTIIVDRNSLDKIKISDKLKNYKIIICLWNGMFDFEEKRIKDQLKKIENKKIKVNFFLVGFMDEYQKNKNLLFSKKILKKKRDYKIECDIKYKLIYKFSNFYYLVRAIKSPLTFLNYYFSKKVIFIGGGILTKEIMNNLKRDHTNDLYQVIKKFYDIFYFKKKYLKGLEYFTNLIYSKKFKRFDKFKQLYIFQTISRCILLYNLTKFSNFSYFSREYRMGLMRCSIYNKNTFLDLGSKCGLEHVYDRSLLLYKDHKYNSIKIDLFRGKTNFKKAIKKFIFLNRKLEYHSTKNSSLNDLKKILSIFSVNIG